MIPGAPSAPSAAPSTTASSRPEPGLSSLLNAPRPRTCPPARATCRSRRTARPIALATDIDFEPLRTHTVTTTQVTYDVDLPKPFCADPKPSEFVRLEGPLQFTLSVSTGPSGRYERTYAIGGTSRRSPR